MNIREWPLGRVMQLPDNCFGRRWPIFLEGRVLDEPPIYDISEVALPERCVVWSLNWESIATTYWDTWYRLALGDQLPASVAEMDALEPLFMGFGVQGPEPRQVRTIKLEPEGYMPMRMPVCAAGRRPILEVGGEELKTLVVRIKIVVSSVPAEVPDCLISA